MMPSNVIELYRAPLALPDTIKALKGWVLWKLEQHPGEKKARKVPYYINGNKRSGQQGSQADRDALSTYDRACYVCERGGYSGIGLAILPEFGITAVDFDDVVTASGIKQEVAALICTTYSEFSPSGNGVRAFFTGTVPANRKDNAGDPQVEFFTSKGFVTITGNTTDVCELLGLEDTVVEVTPALNNLYISRFGAGKASSATLEDIDPRAVREMLDKIDPDPSHDVWFRIALGLHHQFGADGFDLWNEWSARGKTYPGERALRTKWRSIRNDDANPVTIGTVRQYARDAGWTEDFSAEFAPVVDDATTEDVAVEETPWPALSRDRKGMIEATVRNLNKALRHRGMAEMMIGYDEFRDEIMFSTDQGINWQTFKDTDYVTLRDTMERRGFKPIGRELIRDVVAKVAEDNKFDSARQWLLNLPAWDGISRISLFLPRYLGAEQTPYTEAVGAYAWTAMAGRVLEPGCQADMVPILFGDQGIKKSSAVAVMAPHTDFYCEISFAEREENLARKMRGRLVGEIGELRGLHSREVEHIKQFVTRRYEDWTPKFKEFNTKFARRLLFWGTTNQQEFLADETGNRRWLPVPVKVADIDAIVRDREQLWAEARDRFLIEGVAWQDAEQLARNHHQAHMITDSWEHDVTEWLDQVGADGFKNATRKFLRLNDVLKFALGFDSKSISRKEELRIGRVLRGLGYVKKDVKENSKVFKAWVLQCETP